MRTIKLIRGDTWQRTWVIQDAASRPVDLSNTSARLHVRDSLGSLVMQASTDDGKLTVQPLNGRIDLIMPKEETDVPAGTYDFDIEVTFPNGVRRTYEQGTLVVLKDVTYG